MRNVHSMNKRMTVGTKNQKIFSFIIISIFINMVNTKNFFYFIISAFFTFFYYSPSQPKSSKIIWFIRFCFIYMPHSIGARMRTKFPFSRRTITKFFITEQTNIMFSFSISFISTFYRTIDRNIFTVISNLIYFFTCFTRQGNQLCVL